MTDLARIMFFSDNGTRAQVGGKFANLSRLAGYASDLGYLVPTGFCITTHAMTEWLEKPDTVTEATAAGRFERDVSRSMPPVPESLRAHIEQALAKLRPGGFVAVRSSAAEEDSHQASFAGQYRTVLGVRGNEDLLSAARHCAEAAWSRELGAYRTTMGLQTEQPLPALIVQEMVPAAASGVLFSRQGKENPNAICLEAVYGLGERLVSGEDICLRQLIDRQTGDTLELSQEEQTDGLFLDSENGTLLRPLDYAQRVGCPLAAEETAHLCKVATDLEERYGYPLDIEWAIDAERQLFLLQARAFSAS